MDRAEAIKLEIQNNPKYVGLEPSEIAIQLSQEVSQNPPAFQIYPGIWTIDYLVQTLKAKGVIADKDDPPSTQVEIKVKRSDELSLGEITQGDVEQASK